MAYSAIPDSEIQVGAPLTNNLLVKIRDNPIGIANGDSGAPNVQSAGISNGAVTNAKLGTDSVTADKIAANAVGASEISSAAVGQGEIAPNAVGQSEIKEASGQVSTTSASFVRLTLPGGAYGFYPRTKTSTGGALSEANIIGSLNFPITSFTTVISLKSNGGAILTAEQTYITASPPYDLGDGSIPLFVFCEMTKSGKIVSIYSAPEAPWHHNGPTNIMPTRKASGKFYRLAATVDCPVREPGKDVAYARDMAKYLKQIKSGGTKEIEITQAIKNADMGLIPMPMEPGVGNTVVMIDPMSELMHDIIRLGDVGEVSIHDLLYSGALKIGNTKLERCGPPGVDVVSLRWKRV